MNVLLIGGGGREHALAWAIAKSPRCGTLYCAPGNAGIADVAELVALDAGDHQAVSAFCGDNDIGLVVIGPEAPLVAGLADDLREAGIPVFGPGREAAQLEGSKAFTKKLCDEADIPTARYAHFDDRAEALDYLGSLPDGPVVIKADGLAAGKGVTVAPDRATALTAVEECFAGAFGEAGAEVVIEEFLEGEEASFFVLCDGVAALPLTTAQDHKRVGDGDTGPNTGGMGAYSPAPVMSDDLITRTMDEIILPTVAAMKARGTPYMGVLYAGLMITAEGPKLIEYNVRFGDPECQVLMMRLTSDALEALSACAGGRLSDCAVTWDQRPALTVVMAASGYPGEVEKGSVIRGLERAGEHPGVQVFHAGTKCEDGEIRANGGRVLNLTALGRDIREAQQTAYKAVREIDWPEGFYRTDIGWRAIKRDE